MQLRDKTAIVYGGSGALGGAAARAFAREGASVVLLGRDQRKLDAAAASITGARVAAFDVADSAAIAAHAESLGEIDIVLNAVGITHVQGAPLAALTLAEFMHPIESYARAYFNIAQAAAPRLRKGGVFIAISTQGANIAFPGVLGYGVTCAAIEGFTRHLSVELAPRGARAVCIRSNAIPDALPTGSHANQVFGPIAEAAGVGLDAMLESAGQATLLKRMPTLVEFGECAVFAASAGAANMTGAVLNMSGQA